MSETPKPTQVTVDVEIPVRPEGQPVQPDVPPRDPNPVEPPADVDHGLDPNTVVPPNPEG